MGWFDLYNHEDDDDDDDDDSNNDLFKSQGYLAERKCSSDYLNSFCFLSSLKVCYGIFTFFLLIYT